MQVRQRALTPPPLWRGNRKRARRDACSKQGAGANWASTSGRSGRRAAAHGAARLCLPPFGKSPNVHRGSGSQGERQRTSLPLSFPPSLPALSPPVHPPAPSPAVLITARACTPLIFSLCTFPRACVSQGCFTRAFFATLSIQPIIIISSHAFFLKSFLCIFWEYLPPVELERSLGRPCKCQNVGTVNNTSLLELLKTFLFFLFFRVCQQFRGKSRSLQQQQQQQEREADGWELGRWSRERWRSLWCVFDSQFDDKEVVGQFKMSDFQR